MAVQDKDFVWLNKNSYDFLRVDESYIKDNETVAQRVTRMAERAFVELYPNPEYYNLFIEFMTKGFISLASPIWANYGRVGQVAISCFGSYVADSMDSILFTGAEVGMMSKYGGGTSAKLNLRPRGSQISKGGKSEGSVHFSKLFDKIIDTCKQSSVRRGAMAVYLDIEHQDLDEFLTIKHEGSDIQNLFTGVSVGNQWLTDMENRDSDKMKTWAKVLKSRQRVGMPYVFLRDNVNNGKPQIYKDLGLEIVGSNLCAEIMLPSSEDESFVCCISSLNAERYDEWKDTKVAKVLLAFLDTVLTDFIGVAKDIPFLNRAVKFSERHRAVGIGVLGYHSYLQKNMIPFESMEAKMFNAEIFSHIQKETYEESIRLGEEIGFAPIFSECETTDIKRRNTTTMAVAPTSSSSFILGQTSQGIEPFRSNFYIRSMAKKKIPCKNPHLERLLESKGFNTPEVWEKISSDFGSVQKLEELTSEEKEVFKTFAEISQMEVATQAAQRQQFIDQGQSINFLIHPKTPTKDVNSLMMYAYKNGIKSLYYQHSISAVQEYSNNITSCATCEA